MKQVRSAVFHLGVMFLTSNSSFAIIGGVNVHDQRHVPANSVVALQLNYEDELGKPAFKKATAVVLGKRYS